ncbi:unnamed protein product [Porites evermanni]|uniref:Endonuclease/exonuclease/phosphatase domain-containing protein n=1 Tax=Porites evermanni TaxID=104178 RepID=A0ABN8LN25_9CNID|nr:unnamed protein product [Porites evermanni]
MEFSTYLESILLSKEHLVIAGDCNIHVDVPHDPDSLKLLDLLQSVGLQQHITEPTQIQGHTLDLVITRSSDDILNKVPVVDRFISDHASRRTTSVSDLNIFNSYRNRVTYLMNQARQAFYTNFIDENSTDHKRLFRATLNNNTLALSC